MGNKPFETYFDERIVLTGAPPPEGDQYLVYRSGVVYKTSFGQTRGFSQFVDDATVTTITTLDTWTDIANTLTNEAITPTLTFAANEFTYAGIDQLAPTAIRAAASIIKPAPGVAAYSLGIAINGTPVLAYSTVNALDTGIVFLATEWQVALSAGDTIKMMIKNRNNTDDIILQDAQLSVG
jgi:hypothetical protein